MSRRTKILCTLGPTSNTPEVIKALIEAGLNAVRINFSHGSHESHGKVIEIVKKLRAEMNLPIPLILDTKGPEIRLKAFKDGKVAIVQGQEFTLTTRDIEGDNKIVAVSYQDLPKDVAVGGTILLDDGSIELKVKQITDTDVICQAINGGPISTNKGVNVPDVKINLPSITQKDIDDIKFGIEIGFDYIAASFVRTANDVIEIRKVLQANGGSHICIISKIENREGVDNIDEILEVSDGIMVARGDLGVEIPPEEVPLVQKSLIKKAKDMGKPVITATQMLESMITNPRPTRAEASDVANAIFDGTDAIMLSGETANGGYPVEAVKMMARIAASTEKSINYHKRLVNKHTNKENNMVNAISYAACTTSDDLNSPCIVTVSSSGFTARMVSKFRPTCPIVAVALNEVVVRQLNLVWGCIPVFHKVNDIDIFDVALQKAIEFGEAKKGDAVVMVAGVPVGVPGTTNVLKIQLVGSEL